MQKSLRISVYISIFIIFIFSSFSSFGATTGNVDGIDGIDLRDAILSLQVCAGIPPSADIELQADVNLDNKIGLDEAIYAMQVVSGIRCVYSLSMTSKSFTATGGTDNIGVNTHSGCSWTVTSNVDWITIVSSSNGTGNGTVYYILSTVLI